LHQRPATLTSGTLTAPRAPGAIQQTGIEIFTFRIAGEKTKGIA